MTDPLYTRLYKIINLSDLSQHATIDAIRKIIKKGANINYQDEKYPTPIMYAARNGRSDLIIALVGLGADISLKRDSGENLLYFAAVSGDVKTVSRILQYPVEIDAPIKKTDFRLKLEYNITTLSHLCDKYRNPAINDPIIEMIVEKGANINFTDRNTNTLLMKASVDRSNIDLVRLLLRLGANFKKVNHKGQTALDIAKRLKNEEAVDILTTYEENARLNNLILSCDTSNTLEF